VSAKKEEKLIPNAPDRWLVATSPHVRSPETVSQIMWTVILALLPACVAGLVVFGWHAGLIMALAVLGAVLSEAAIQRCLGRPVTVSDGSAAVTGLLLACCLPPDVSWYVPLVGSFVAIFVGKQVFGGLGRNYFNPALLGRAFLQFAFATQISKPLWPILMRKPLLQSVTGNILTVADGGVDAQTLASPLAVVKPSAEAALASPLEAVGRALHLPPNPSEWEYKWGVIRDLALGNTPGCIGEVSALALLLGGAILIANRYVNWRLPLTYILTTALVVVLLPVKAGGAWVGLWAGQWGYAAELAAVHLLAGGLFLGAFFMITDMVTSPTTSKGQVIYGLAAGVLVALIRVYGGYPEGVCYSILLVNAGRLLVERISVPRVFGTGKGAERA
jgi:electron transport complex protein RnfD